MCGEALAATGEGGIGLQESEEVIETDTRLTEGFGQDDWLDCSVARNDGLGEGIVPAHHDVAPALSAHVEAQSSERGNDLVRRELRIPGHAARSPRRSGGARWAREEQCHPLRAPPRRARLPPSHSAVRLPVSRPDCGILAGRDRGRCSPHLAPCRRQPGIARGPPFVWYPRQDSNLRSGLRRPVPYPLGHWGTRGDYSRRGARGQPRAGRPTGTM
jgi:hypothetical protein